MTNTNEYTDPFGLSVADAMDVRGEIKQRPQLSAEFKAELQRERAIIEAQIERENIEKQTLIDKWVEDNTPKKGIVTKEIWGVPIPTHKDIMMSDLDYQFLAKVLLDSNNGGKANNMCGERFIYKNKLWALDDEDNIPKIAKELNISESTFKRKIKALLNVQLGIVEIGNNADGEIFYKIKYDTDGRYFITIKSDMLDMLITSTNSNMIKLYSLMWYNLTESIKAEDGTYKGYKYIRKQMTYDYMAENIGLVRGTNRKRFKTMLDSLALLGFIKIYEIDTPIRKIDKATNTEVVLTVKGYEYELCTYEEWLEVVSKATVKENKKPNLKMVGA